MAASKLYVSFSLWSLDRIMIVIIIKHHLSIQESTKQGLTILWYIEFDLNDSAKPKRSPEEDVGQRVQYEARQQQQPEEAANSFLYLRITHWTWGPL